MNKKNEALKQLKELKDSFESKSAELKRIIEDSDKPKTIFERVTDIPSAITELGENDVDVKEYRFLQTAGASLKTLQGLQIALFCKAMNEGVKMSWKNTNQQKWYTWFDYRHAPENPDFVYCVDCTCGVSYSVSSRHTVSTREKALHVVKCILQLCHEYYSD